MAGEEGEDEGREQDDDTDDDDNYRNRRTQAVPQSSKSCVIGAGGREDWLGQM